MRLPPLAVALLAVLAPAVVVPTVAPAQASPTVSPLDPAYRHVDVLAALGMADAVMVGQRPYSRRQIGRIAAAARRTRARWEATLADAATPPARRRRLAGRLAASHAPLDALGAAYGPEIAAAASGAAPAPRGRALDVAALDVTATNAVQRAVPGTPLGTSDAVVVGLTAYREGRPVVRGATAFAETAHWGAWRWIAGSARLRARLATPDAADPAARHTRAQALTAHQASVRLVAGPMALTLGREHVAWGQGRHGGPLLSTHAPALDLIMLASDVPIRVPLVSRVLGPMQGTAFVADLGARQNYPGANLSGYKLNAHPLRWLEIGVGTVNQWGGRGAPAAPAAKRLLDQLLVIDSFGGVDDFRFSNKLAGIDTRITIPALGGLAAYYEVQFDDFDHTRLRSLVTEDAGQVAGVQALALGPDGRWELGAELRRTGLRYYQHLDFASGVAYERFFLGDPLGPQGRAGSLRGGRRDAAGGGVWVELGTERRGNDQYVTPTEPTFHFVRIERRPVERRARVLATLERRAAAGRGGPTAIVAQLGAERVTDFAFAEGTDRLHVLARLGVELRPR